MVFCYCFQALGLRPFHYKSIRALAWCLGLLFCSPLFGIERIITLSPSTTEMLYSIGAGDKIVATVSHSDYPKQAATIPRIGNYQSLNIEAILSLKPDLIVAWPEGNPAQQLAQLEQLNIPIHYSYATSLDALPQELIELGKLTGNVQQATQVANKIKATLQTLKQTYSHLAPVTLFYQVWHNPLMTASGNSWLGEIFTLCGASNIFAGNRTPFPVVSIEHILVNQPELILAADNNPEVLAIWKQWPQLNAVKNNHLYTLKPDIISRYGPRLPEGIKALCEAVNNAR